MGNPVVALLFHSVSAFCNAGFSTFPMNLMEPGIRLCYSGQAVIMALIMRRPGIRHLQGNQLPPGQPLSGQAPPPAHAVDPVFQTGDDRHGHSAGWGALSIFAVSAPTSEPLG
ncbi:MAG: hypothetical protein ACLT8E_02130 [Akkermansia sp.]